MSTRATLMVAAALGGVVGLVGCGQLDRAPDSLASPSSPEVLFLVHNEVWSIRLDGTDRHLVAAVGDDSRRTAWPRFLPDGRMAVLADETGGIFPYVGAPGGAFQRLSAMNVTLNDSLCGVTIAGQSRLIFTNTPFTPFLPMSAIVYRVDVDDPAPEAVGFQAAGPDGQPGALSDPAPYDDGRVVLVRTVRPDGLTPGTSSIELLRVDRPYEHDPSVTSEKIATVPDGYLATSPARLPDGRIVFLRVDPTMSSDTAIGEMFVIGLDNHVQSTGATGVLALEVVGDQVVYEVGGADGVSDLVRTDLVGPPVNITNTPYVSEHLGWSG
ncbi:MAG TPA: hypothetical protein VII38_17075 [Polyangia bacterium]